MTMLPDPIRKALTAGHLAHLVTTNPDGSPHVTIVWIGLEGDEIVSGSPAVPPEAPQRATGSTGLVVDRGRRPQRDGAGQPPGG